MRYQFAGRRFIVVQLILLACSCNNKPAATGQGSSRLASANGTNSGELSRSDMDRLNRLVAAVEDVKDVICNDGIYETACNEMTLTFEDLSVVKSNLQDKEDRAGVTSVDDTSRCFFDRAVNDHLVKFYEGAPDIESESYRNNINRTIPIYAHVKSVFSVSGLDCATIIAAAPVAAPAAYSPPAISGPFTFQIPIFTEHHDATLRIPNEANPEAGRIVCGGKGIQLREAERQIEFGSKHDCRSIALLTFQWPAAIDSKKYQITSAHLALPSSEDAGKDDLPPAVDIKGFIPGPDLPISRDEIQGNQFVDRFLNRLVGGVEWQTTNSWKDGYTYVTEVTSVIDAVHDHQDYRGLIGLAMIPKSDYFYEAKFYAFRRVILSTTNKTADGSYEANSAKLVLTVEPRDP